MSEAEITFKGKRIDRLMGISPEQLENYSSYYPTMVTIPKSEYDLLIEIKEKFLSID